MPTHEPEQTDTKPFKQQTFPGKPVSEEQMVHANDVDTVIEVSDIVHMLNGQTLYTAYVAARHARFNDGGSFVAWNHLNPQEQEAWNETADKFVQK